MFGEITIFKSKLVHPMVVNVFKKTNVFHKFLKIHEEFVYKTKLRDATINIRILNGMNLAANKSAKNKIYRLIFANVFQIFSKPIKI